MENFFESYSNIDRLFRPEHLTSEIEENAKLLLLEHAGVMDKDEETQWEVANQARFEELMKDPRLNYVERLVSDDSRKEAFNELKTKLYQ